MDTLKLVCVFLIFSAISAPAPASIVPSLGGRLESNNKECSICHLPWLDEVKNETPHLLSKPVERRYVTEQSCYSCHDGSTVDSRYEIWETPGHKSGVKPTAAVSMPAGYPLDTEGALTCATCHMAHKVQGSKDSGITTFMREPNVDSSMCMVCHPNEEGGPQQGKHPLGIVVEQIPEAIINAGGKLGAGNTIICETCHAAHGSVNEDSLVLPSSEPDISGSTLCEACHTDSPSLAPDQRLKRHFHPVNAPLPDDANLPETWDNGEVPRLGKGKSVNCRACHSPHNGIKVNRLLVSQDREDGFCLTCHSSKSKIYNTSHDIARLYPEEKNIAGEKASEKGTCRACHLVHTGAGPKMWAREIATPEMGAICNSCHAEGKIAEEALTGEFSHPVNVRQLKGQSSGLLPLFTDEGKKYPQGKVMCASCHDVHNGSIAASTTQDQVASEGARYTSFLRAPYDDAATLCANCHEENALIVGTDHDLRVTAPGAQNINQETVEQGGVCSACHLVHQAKAKGLWAREIGPSDNQNEALCRSCHSKGEAASGKSLPGTNHPMGKKVADARATLKDETFRFYEKVLDGKAAQTELPLFSDEGNRSVDGVISCSTCHDAHRWSPGQSTIGSGKNLEGDGSSSFLRKQNQADSNLCATCHTQKALVVNTDHNMSLTAPEERNMLGETVAQSGVCSACHVAHGARDDSYLLWARSPNAEYGLRQEQLCLSCHAAGKDLASKTVKHYSHPEDAPVIQLARPGQPRYAHVFDEKGRKVRAGIISCPTCHDPHLSSSEVSGFDTETTLSRNEEKNFLRIKSAENLCKDCHGLGSLMKYTYFHKNPRKAQKKQNNGVRLD